MTNMNQLHLSPVPPTSALGARVRIAAKNGEVLLSSPLTVAPAESDRTPTATVEVPHSVVVHVTRAVAERTPVTVEIGAFEGDAVLEAKAVDTGEGSGGTSIVFAWGPSGPEGPLDVQGQRTANRV